MHILLSSSMSFLNQHMMNIAIPSPFWLIQILSILVCSVLSLITIPKKKPAALPPGPPSIPILGNIFWFVPSFSSLGPALRHLHTKYGPIVTLRAGSTPAIFIMSADLAHRTLVQMGQAFAYRPPPLGASRSVSSNHHTVNLASYNSEWRLLRHNMSSFLTGSLLSSSVMLYQSVDMFFQQSCTSSNGGKIVVHSETIQFTLFRFFAGLCFGEVLDAELLSELRAVQLGILDQALKLSVFNLLPKVLMLAYLPRLWKLLSLRNRQEELIVPIITAHRRQSCINNENYNNKKSYLDNLLALRVKESGGRALNDQEIVNLCSEFINAATETTSTALEWIMANLVSHESIQEKLFDNILQFNNKKGHDRHIDVESLRNIPYLRAVVLEGLRRHPPAHILLPHTVEKDINLDGYVIPKGAVVNYSVAEIGRDSAVWEQPRTFIPERFLIGDDRIMNVNARKRILMMPFGAGRRACPGEAMAMLVLEYFVANFVRRFRWRKIDGEEIDMTELPGLVVAMKHPFRAHLVSRRD